VCGERQHAAHLGMALLGALGVLLLDREWRGHVLGVAQRSLLRRLAEVAWYDLLSICHAGDVDPGMILARALHFDTEVAAAPFIGRVVLEVPGRAILLHHLRLHHHRHPVGGEQQRGMAGREGLRWSVSSCLASRCPAPLPFLSASKCPLYLQLGKCAPK
jgi:hypothetical protein